VKALLAFDNSSVTVTIIIIMIIIINNNNNSLITKQLEQDSIPFRKRIYVLVLAK
jgi:hypothetical protein